MDSARGTSESRDARFDELYAEAKSTLGYGANSLRSVTERYREAYRDSLARWHRMRDLLEAAERAPTPSVDESDAASAAEVGAEDARQKTIRGDIERLTGDLGKHQQELSKLELSVRSMENAWLFLERGDASLLAEVADAGLPTDLQMRIVQAQEAERSRLAQEVHDGPAQALSNAIFQVEYIERVLDEDTRVAHNELRFLREQLRRELGEVRTFISQLRPPLLDELGLDGSIMDAVESMAALTGASVETDLRAPGEQLNPSQQTAVLRIVQEALQNVRKHAGSSRTVVATAVDGTNWVLEVSDDGRGFDVTAVAARGRRNFGLQFMRERAELIGARFEVRSRPGGGTVVWLSIPVGEESA
ncbi:MAG: sensor histidine kinase [Candidatus Limnocylindrales bacterium]|jgi:two-component system sensor histidine kinase DegS